MTCPRARRGKIEPMRWPAAPFFCALCALGLGCKTQSGGGDSPKLRGLVARTVGFEGEIEQEITTSIFPGKATRYLLKMKGDRARIETTGVVMITDLTARKRWSIDPTSKSYSEYEWAAPDPDAGAAVPTQVHTGRHEVIAGHDCEIVQATLPPSSNWEMCVTQDMSSPVLRAFGGLGGWSDELGFAMRVVLKDASGREVSRAQVTRLEKKSIPDSDVNVPPGYVLVK